MSIDKERAASNNRASLVRLDEQYRKALAIVIEAGRASVSMVQRKMNIRYSEAQAFIVRMVNDGLIGLEDTPGLTDEARAALDRAPQQRDPLTDEEIIAWVDGFIQKRAFNYAVAVQIATEAAKWVRERLAASPTAATQPAWGPDHPDWKATHGCTHECREGVRCKCSDEAPSPTAATQGATASEPTDARTCSCHPNDNPPKPCPRKFAYNECVAASEGAAAPATPRDDALVAEVYKALCRAFTLGQTYWDQADSESYSQNRKADETQARFKKLLADTIAAMQPAVQQARIDDLDRRATEYADLNDRQALRIAELERRLAQAALQPAVREWQSLTLKEADDIEETSTTLGEAIAATHAALRRKNGGSHE